MTEDQRTYIKDEALKVSRERRYGFYRWMLMLVSHGYDPKDDLMGLHHGRNT